jgi:hypothetical protein
VQRVDDDMAVRASTDMFTTWECFNFTQPGPS